MVNPDADFIEHLMNQAKRELKVLPAVAITRETADAIDASNIMRLSADEIDALLRAEAA
jgi:hypothetical protein